MVHDMSPRQQVLDALEQVGTAAICTSAGDSLRVRMMHFGYDDDLNLYVASMKGDPKVLQLTHNPDMAVLIHLSPADETQASETEITARAVLVNDEGERMRGFNLVAKTSPIVRHFLAEQATDRLVLIKILPRVIKHRIFYQIVQGKPPTVLTFPEHEEAISTTELLKRYVIARWTSIRAFSLTASLVPILFGALYAWNGTGHLNLEVLLATLLGGLAIQAGCNLLNDYGDYKNGSDNQNRSFVRPFTGGSRVIQLGLMSPVAVLSWGLGLLGVAGMAGLYLVAKAGIGLLPVLLFGFVTGALYSDKTRGLVRFGLGELIIGLNFGVFMVLGAFYAQTGGYAWQPVVASLPVTILVTAIAYINQFADHEADAQTGKQTWTVRLGLQRAGRLFPLFYLATYGSLAVAIGTNLLPIQSLAAFVALPFSLQAVTTAWREYASPFDLIPANAGTALSHLLVGGAMIWALLADRLPVFGLPALAAAALLGLGGYMWWFIQRQTRLSQGLQARFSQGT